MAIGDKVLIFNVQVHLNQQTYNKFDEIGFDAAAVTTKVLDPSTKLASSPSDIKATPTLSAPLFRSVNQALWLCQMSIVRRKKMLKIKEERRTNKNEIKSGGQAVVFNLDG